MRGLRSFTRETEIDLERLGEHGLFAVFGPTGAGKSTILDGIFLALFGKCPRGEAGECVSAGALELVVRLELGEGHGEAARELAVERRFRWSRKRDADAGSLGAELRGSSKHPPLRVEERKGGEWIPVDPGGRKADEYLRDQIVRVSMADFQQAVVLPQGQFDALLRARPAERRTLVASLFRTEHLGQPLIEVLRSRELAVRTEIGRLEEAEHEVAVGDDEVALAVSTADDEAARAEALAGALVAAERLAVEQRLARGRCAARDAAAEGLARVERELEARAPDRARIERARRAADAWPAIVAIELAEEQAREAEARAARTSAEARAAEARRDAAARALAEAIAARTADLPGLLEQLGRARLAEERGEDLEALEADRDAAARALDEAARALAGAEAARARAAAALASAEGEEREAAATLERIRVGEDERAEAVARVAIAELAAAEGRVVAVIAAERARGEARVAELDATLAALEEAARTAEGDATRARAEQRSLEVDAQRAAGEIEVAERALDEARRAAAAASLAADLRPGEACPVCGSRAHPGADHRVAALAIGMGERNDEAARRAARAAERAVADATREANARDEEARTQAARVEAAAAERDAAARALARQVAGDEVPRAVIEAKGDERRVAAKAELALGAVAEQAREALARAARAEPIDAAATRVTALNRRAREAEQLGRGAAAARERAAGARRDVAAAAEAVAAADRARALAHERHAAAASIARARREEIRALLADLESPDAARRRGGRGRGRALPGQRGLFDPPPRVRTAAAWIDELEGKASAIARREELAEAAIDEARAAAGKLALEAGEAGARRSVAAATLERAAADASAAIARSGFAGRDALRAARVEPAQLAAMEAEHARLERDRERLRAIHAERARDVDVEVAEGDALAAERARDDARREAKAAEGRAAQAAARREELGRRQVRAREIASRIALLEPRARRLARVRQTVGSNQLSELAAERHLEAVTRGAAALLRSLSADRYTLVRTPEGAFAVADAAHGGLVRPPSTLSGGETFLVSLALALSLSERIQLAGRTRFDFFFLDEGFGSLDAGTLEVALGALERLRGPHRVIGMISHVGAIEERVPRKLRVLPARPGGSATVAHEPDGRA